MSALATTNGETGAMVPANMNVGAMEAALAMGDLSRLTSNDRLKYVGAICQSVGLNPLTRPFDFITLQGKLTMYANKGCAEQLRAIHGVSCEIVERAHLPGCYMVRVRARDGKGRVDEATGVVVLADGAKGEALANAMMKAETKAKRRATLSLCGLGMIDESELDTVQSGPASAMPSGESAADVAASLSGEPEVIEAEVVPEFIEPTTPPPKAETPKVEKPKDRERLKKDFAAVVAKWSGVHRDDLGDACRRVAAKLGVADLSAATDADLVRLTEEAKSKAGGSYIAFVT